MVTSRFSIYKKINPLPSILNVAHIRFKIVMIVEFFLLSLHKVRILFL